MVMKLYFDGGCKPNPGAMEIAYVDEGVTQKHKYLGHGTNNQAEWLAFLHAIRYAGGFGIPDVEIFGDSKLVIEQFHGRWKCNDETLRAIRDEALEFATIIPNLQVKWIGRDYNLAGQYIESLHK